jgi:hypothetical protein
VEIHPELYMALLQKLQDEESTLRHYQDLPHPDDSSVLTLYANECNSFASEGGLYISKTQQNWLVAYRKNGSTQYGWITHIYSLPELNNRIIVAVKVLRDACMGDMIDINDNFLQTLSDLELQIMREDSSREIVDPGELIAVCAYRSLPAWSFRYHLPLIVLRQVPHNLSLLLFPPSTY